MVATNDIGSSTDGVRSMGPAGAVQSYMSKIPAHLQGLAIRKQDKRETDWMTAKEDQDKDLAAIQAELDADDDEDEGYNNLRSPLLSAAAAAADKTGRGGKGSSRHSENEDGVTFRGH